MLLYLLMSTATFASVMAAKVILPGMETVTSWFPDLEPIFQRVAGLINCLDFLLPVDELITCMGLMMAFEVMLFTIRMALWAVRKFMPTI